ncbi:unnamed protein product [Lactuca saligna]|uniref:Uncharacterized protein n=1 Tax=Lactuca saligna TaxID=75948 RepID=A0AA35VTB0_LACSI|nr:unnamed protein product [Lactuca saligna]
MKATRSVKRKGRSRNEGKGDTGATKSDGEKEARRHAADHEEGDGSEEEDGEEGNEVSVVFALQSPCFPPHSGSSDQQQERRGDGGRGNVVNGGGCCKQ